MKRAISVLLSFIIVLMVFPITAFADAPVVISGENATIMNKEADALIINGVEYKRSDSVQIAVSITVDGNDNPNACVCLNGKKISGLSNGVNEISFSSMDLIDGENELRVMISTPKGPYDDSYLYGSVNGDDMTVNSVLFDGTSSFTPNGVNLYMPIVGQAGSEVKKSAYSADLVIGDGWNDSTKLGGNTPNTPVSVGYLFEKPVVEGLFNIDTTKIPDGNHTVSFVKDGNVISETECIVDNTAPDIIFNIANGANVSRLDKISYSISDITEANSKLYVDGKLADSIDLISLSLGNHTIMVSAVDKAGNLSQESLVFNLTDKKYIVEFNKKSVKMSVLGEATVYSAKLVTEIRMFENSFGVATQDYLRSDDEVLVSFNKKKEIVTSSVGNSLPYQSFVFNTDEARDDKMYISYSGETGNGCDIVLKAWNYKESRWDVIGTVPSGESVTIPVTITDYSSKGRMRVNAIPGIVNNGSDTLIWNSDTQYYSRFEDLNQLYYDIANYTVEQYNAGNIGYYVHTGDLVDQTNVGDAVANSEFLIASKAQKILDDAMVPNGVVSGNHDVLHTEGDYKYYWKYFGEGRYKDFPWYGGSLNNNMHHYDLVSLGGYDFLFMYLGCYKETEADTIAWANAVCQAYPDYNVVICTHEYLLPSGAYSSDRSQVIWDEIIVPNENVKMVLCGHNTGVCDQIKQVGDSDRYVLEILADYQFAELGVGPQHVLNGCTCDGEGYVRLMTFNNAGQLVSTTYSPSAGAHNVDPYNFYPSYADSFVYDLDLIPANRSIKTNEFNVAYKAKVVGEIGDDNINLIGKDCFFAEIKGESENTFTEIFVLDEYKTSYRVPKRNPPEAESAEKIMVTGHSNVSGAFRMNEENNFPQDEFIKIGLNLMPDAASDLKQTSGSNDRQFEVVDGAVTITHQQGNNATWVTLSNNVGQKIDVTEYNRIYFGVTANKNTKWNLSVNFAGKELNFSQNKDIAKLFGYVNEAPSDIMGTWNGYIELDDIIQGTQTVNSIYLVSATPGETVTFDYLFLAKSEGGRVEFITNDTTSIVYDANVGDTINLNGDPFLQGYTFDGWYTEKEGGSLVTDGVDVKEGVQKLYARFSEKSVDERQVKSYNTEVTVEKTPVFKIVFVSICLLGFIFAIGAVTYKIKSSSKGGKKV